MTDFEKIKKNLKTVRDWIRFGATWFSKEKLFLGHGTDNAWDEALALVLHALYLKYEFGPKILDCRLTDAEKEGVFQLFQHRVVKRLPVPYLTNVAYYGGFEFYVDHRVLIPRSPIFELIEKQFSPWIKANEVCSILDIGTGSACLSIIAAHYFPDATIDAVDVDPKALEVAKINVEKYDLSHQIHLIQSDLFAKLQGRTYDIIITNPPYVDAEDMVNLPKEYRHEPIHALQSGTYGLDHIQEILLSAGNYLNQAGILVGEVGNSAAALEINFPNLDFIWADLEHGGDGVFLLSYEQLMQLK